MAFNNITNLSLGNIIQIAFSKGLRLQISQDYRDWEQIKMAKDSDPDGREKRFYFQTSYGPASVQYRNPGTIGGYAFPNAQQSQQAEHTAVYKELATTIELEQNLWRRAQLSPEKYAEPLANEMESKMTAQKRRLAADLYADGTGVMATIASAAVTSPTSNQLVFTLSASASARGFVGFAEYDDIYVLKSASNGTSALDTNLATEPAYWKVIDKDRVANTLTMQGLDSSLAATASMTSISVQPTAGDVFYRYGQPTMVDLTSPIADYGSITEVVAGLQSLISKDGRVIHGITMTGANAGTIIDASGDALDVSQVHQLMDNVKIRVGQSAYSWPKIICSPEAQRAFIESREADRRFTSVADNKRGVNKFAYIHQNDTLELYTSEFCPIKQLYVMPEGKSGNKVLEYWGTDFEVVRAKDGEEFRLKPSSAGGYLNQMVCYMEMFGTLVCKHPAAVGRLENFSV